jgi:hypothetical protein
MSMAFKTPLSTKQWMALVLLIFGCGLEQLSSFDLDTGVLALIGLSAQAFCSSAAGVYNQYLLKTKDLAGLGLWEKNMFMYAWGILFTFIMINFQAPELVENPYIFIDIFYKENLLIYIILTNAFMGFSTSLLLRDMNVLYKEYANFLEMLILVAGTWLLFGITPHILIIPATMIVCYSLYTYNIEAARLEEQRAASPAPAVLVPLATVAVADPRQD